MDESEYLGRVRALWARAWPVDTPREPHYPIGRAPLTDYLRHWARTTPDKPAIHFYGHDTTFAQLDDLSDRFAALLAQHGIGAGDRVAVFLSNCPQFNAVFFGILKLGAVYVPISPLSQRVELMHALTDATPRAIVALDRLMPLVSDVRAETSLEHVFVTRYADVLPAQPTLPLPAMLTEPPLDCADAIDLMPALARTTPISLPPASLDAAAALNYTGGTTGLPKGCIHTQGDMVDMAAAFSAVSLRADADTVMLSFYPQFWIAGENTGLIFPAFLGVPLVLLARWSWRIRVCTNTTCVRCDTPACHRS